MRCCIRHVHVIVTDSIVAECCAAGILQLLEQLLVPVLGQLANHAMALVANELRNGVN